MSHQRAKLFTAVEPAWIRTFKTRIWIALTPTVIIVYCPYKDRFPGNNTLLAKMILKQRWKDNVRQLVKPQFANLVAMLALHWYHVTRYVSVGTLKGCDNVVN